MRVNTGIEGLDDVLLGGIPAGTLLLAQGLSGSGKTTVGLQFLIEGARRGERCLLVTNGETPEELASIAGSHGWSLDGVDVVRWEEEVEEGETSADYTLFPPAEVEVGETLSRVFAAIDRLQPARLVIDAISGIRILARDAAFFLLQLKRLHRFLSGRSCTTMLLNDTVDPDLDARAQTISHAVMELQHLVFGFGGERRRLRIRKVRGSRYVGGFHDMTIETGGLRVFPRLVATSHAEVPEAEPAASGLAELDALAGGGLPRGSSTLLTGPAGTGKSTLSALYLRAAAERGERSGVFLFDEPVRSFLRRSRGLGIDLDPHAEAGRVAFTHLDPAELSPGQIAHAVLEQVRGGTRLILFDTLNGYLQSAAEEPMVLLHLRELLSYLSGQGTVTLLTLTQHGILGQDIARPVVDLSFLADNVLLLRYFESGGSIHQALSMVKRRTGPHERTIRRLILEPGRVRLSGPLSEFSGVLTGVPHYERTRATLEEPMR